MGESKGTVKFLLHAIFTHDLLRDSWVAHCLEFDLVCTAKSHEEVNLKLERLLLGHIKFAMGKGLDPHLDAPAKYWEKIKTTNVSVQKENLDFFNETGKPQFGLQELCLR
ncbi:MAG: hypothetical protein HOP00_12115 [Nitrospira sp.]|nr:hypothetical protein [Nitrospira sp.]